MVLPGEFTGLRSVNDTIVSMDFSTGGKLGTVSVRRWNGVDYYNPAGASGFPALETLNATVGQFCTTDDFICGLNNGSPIPAPAAPWEPGAIDTNEFTEFGVDISGLLGTSPCFSNVEGKTRSSTSFTAELKDFAGPFGFDVCKLKVKKTATPTISKVGDSVTYNYNITNNGAITLFKKSIIDSRFGTLAANCGASLSPGAFCSFSIVHVVNAPTPTP